MAKSRRRYINVENSFFERQPRIARHPTGDRNEDEEPRNLGVQSPSPRTPRTRLTGYVSQFAWANLSRNSYPSFLPRFVPFSPSSSHLSRISRAFFLSLPGVARCVLVLRAPITFGSIQPADDFPFHPSPYIASYSSDETFQGYAFACQFLSVFVYILFNIIYFIYILWKVWECKSNLSLELRVFVFYIYSLESVRLGSRIKDHQILGNMKGLRKVFFKIELFYNLREFWYTKFRGNK